MTELRVHAVTVDLTGITALLQDRLVALGCGPNWVVCGGEGALLVDANVEVRIDIRFALVRRRRLTWRRHAQQRCACFVGLLGGCGKRCDSSASHEQGLDGPGHKKLPKTVAHFDECSTTITQ